VLKAPAHMLSIRVCRLTAILRSGSQTRSQSTRETASRAPSLAISRDTPAADHVRKLCILAR
jgi:hypothetical protein